MASKKLPRNSKKHKSPWVRRLKQASVLFLTFCFIAFSILGFFYFTAHRDAEDAMLDLSKRIDQGLNSPTTKILSRDGVVLYSITKENRTYLKLSEIPKFVQNAVIAAEDKRFYEHSGVDISSIARVVFVDVRGRKMSQGGSTITMQLVKLLFNGSSKTFQRKMNDIAYAQVLEQKLPKDRILEIYLNKVFFGEGAFGIGEAAKVYFNKSVDDLTIGEAAMLARCIRRPSFENPIRDLEAATNNRDVVLGIMRDEQMITDEQFEKATQEKPHVNPKPADTHIRIRVGAEYFVQHVLQVLQSDLGLDLETGGYTIETSLDFNLQKFAQKSVQEFVDKYRYLKVNQGAFMVMDSDGYILTEIGGLNYAKHQSNIITHGGLQPGSGFKPIVYATALKAGTITMDSTLSNAHVREVDDAGNVWEPSNSNPRENLPSYSLRSALANSINLCAIHAIHDVGPLTVVQTAKDSFGFHSRLYAYDSLALGTSEVSPMEMAEAYSVFMLHGDRVHPQPVLRITDQQGNLVKQYEPERFTGVFDATVSGEVDELLRGVVESGTGYAAMKVPNARGKTGTTNDAKDAWFTGYADGVLAVGWFGHEVKSGGKWVRQPMNPAVYGGTTTAKVWADIMVVARERYAKTGPAITLASAPKPKHKDPEAGPDVDPDLIAVQPDSKGAPNSGGDVSKTPTDVPPLDTGDPGDNTDQTSTDPNKSDQPGADNTKPPKNKPAGAAPASLVSAKPVGPATATKTKTVPKAKVDPESDTVTLEICEDSGLIANPYCNETVTRTFKRGKEPKRKCRIHGPGG